MQLCMFYDQVPTGLFEKAAEVVADAATAGGATDVKILKYITEPFTDLIVQVQ